MEDKDIKFIDFTDTTRSDDACIFDNDRINQDKLIEDLKTKAKGKTVIGIVDREIVKEDGTVMYEYIGMNCTTIGGTQTIVENTFAHIDPTSHMELTTIDGIVAKDDKTKGEFSDAAAAAVGIPTGWKLDTITNNTVDRTVPRKIIGFMVADDGAVGQSVKIVDRKTKAFDFAHLIPFSRGDARSDVPVYSLQIGKEGDTMSNSTYEDRTQINNSIDQTKKYALRVQIPGDSSSEGSMDTAYYVKLLKFDVTNIFVNGSRLTSNNFDGVSDIRLNLDVRSKVQMNIVIDPQELSDSYAHNNGSRSVRGAMISSFMLVAGRPVTESVLQYETGTESITNATKTVNTYRDLVVTNRINFTELPVERTHLGIRYTIYYV